VPPSHHAENAPRLGEPPAELVARLATQKAADVAPKINHGLVIGCDTIAECDGHLLGKPRDMAHARRMLLLLRGRQHRVLSGLCLWQRPTDQKQTGVAVTHLVMENLSDAQLEEYLRSGAWQGKAGAFGYQDRIAWLRIVEGSESNVVGLPLELLEKMLATSASPSALKIGNCLAI